MTEEKFFLLKSFTQFERPTFKWINNYLHRDKRNT
jgi:hypothetical protein